jgi:DNA repair exonuclease SbcCD ATPase subunit
MRNWIGPLKSSPHASLSALGPELEKKVTAADAAKAALATAQTANRVFRTTGARKALIDEFNALRKLTYGKLAELPHKYPDRNLPGSFPDGFFKRVSRPKEAIEPPTSADILTQIAELETTLSALREKLKEVLKQEEAEAQAERDREAEDAELAALEKQRKELDAKIAEKKAKHPKS